MDPTAFRIRRVLLGVVVGLVLVSVAFYGWVQYRRAQYDDRERAVLSRYHQDYTLCVTAGNAAVGCAARVVNACVADSFWSLAKPFASDPESARDDPLERCRSGATG